MKTISEYKDMALQSLEGKWTKGVVATIIYFIAASILGQTGGFFPSPEVQAVASLGISLLLLPMAWSFAVYFLRLIRDEDISYSRLFDGYQQFARTFLTELLKALYIILWSILLIVPGIIKSYSYAMTEFVMKDDDTLAYNAAIEKSMALMEGHKMQLFLIDLSMIGWIILSLLTLGIGFIFLEPYMYACHAHFYEDLKAAQD